MTTSNEAEGFEWAFRPNYLPLDLLGVWPSENNSRRWRDAIVTPTLILVMFFGLALPQAHALVEVHRQLPLVADNIITFNICIVGITKISILWMRREEIAELLRGVNDDWLAEKSTSEWRSMRRHARRARVLTIFSTSVGLTCVASFVFSPIFSMSIRQLNCITDLHPKRHMPFQTFYLYDVYSSPVFEFTYLHQMISFGLAAISHLAPDNFFGALVSHACAQCEMLEGTFERLAASAPSADSTTFVEQLGRAVSRHVRIIRFVDDVESLFNLMILAHVLYIVLTVGFLGFLCAEAFSKNTESPTLIQVVTLVGTSFTMLLLSFIICSDVEMLATRSCRLLESIYLPNLHSIPKSRARDLTIMMMHSREPLKLTAGKILNLSLNTYLQLMKRIFGYVSMLITVNQSD